MAPFSIVEHFDVFKHGPTANPSLRQNMLAQRKRNRTLKEKIEALKAQRDQALTLFVEANEKILELTLENASL